MVNPTETSDGSRRTTERRTISPFDLTSADNPGAVISRPLLRSRNYDEWACAFKTALCSRKKFGFLDGSISKPAPDSSDFEDWEPINALLVSWIKMSIEPSLLSNISHRENAKDLWDYLRKRFSVTSGAKKQQIKADLANCKQHGLSVEEYVGKLTKIWDSVSTYRPLRTCKCVKCVCDLQTQQEKDLEDDQVHQFLYGLDDRMFGNIRSNLIARSPFPSFEEACNLVQQEEDLLSNNKMREDKQEVTAFATQTKPRLQLDKRTRDTTTLCKHCNRRGHASESCFAVIGYPEWWGDRPRYREKAATLNSKPMPVYANAVNSAPTSSAARINRVVTNADRDAVSGLSDDQWKAVLHLLRASPNGVTETLTGPHFEDGDWSG